MGVAREVLAELGLDITMFGVAKGESASRASRNWSFPTGASRCTMRPDAPALHLIQEIRDEAHRFAITGHRARRAKARNTSRLEDIPGVGPTRRQAVGGLRRPRRRARCHGRRPLPGGWDQPAPRRTDIQCPAIAAVNVPMPFNIPNSLTWARIALIPFFVGIYYLPADVMSAEKKPVATLTFIAAAVTDWFDGYLARSLGQTSALAPSSTRWRTS